MRDFGSPERFPPLLTVLCLLRKSLKSALEQVTRSLDNHLRALILALMANMYLLTASDHAQLMLKTCQQLASGLGAPEDKANELLNGGSVVGNVPLGLWVGEKFLGELPSWDHGALQ